MDFIKALTFITEDPRWKEKVVIGAALALFAPLIVPALILLGYALRLTQNMRDGKRPPLPEWDDWSGDLVRGFKLAIVYLIWGLPAALAAIPLFFGAILADSDSFVRTFGVMILVGTTCLTFLYGIFVTLMTPGFVLWFARRTDSERPAAERNFRLGAPALDRGCALPDRSVDRQLCILYGGQRRRHAPLPGGTGDHHSAGHLCGVSLSVQSVRPDRLQGQNRRDVLSALCAAGPDDGKRRQRSIHLNAPTAGVAGCSPSRKI